MMNNATAPIEQESFGLENITPYYWSNGYLLLVDYLLYLEDVQEEEEAKQTKLLEKSQKKASGLKSEQKTSAATIDTIEDLLCRVDLSSNRKPPPSIESFEDHCLVGGFEIFLSALKTSKDNIIDPLNLFCRAPTKEAFLLFIQYRIHSKNGNTFSRRLDVDSIRELRNKFIEKSFLKITSSDRIIFPSDLKTREKKTDFLLNVCNLFQEENSQQTEYTKSFFDKIFGSFCSIRDSSMAVALPKQEPIEKDILLAKRLISASYRNVMMIYFLQVIFSSSTSLSGSSNVQESETSTLFHKSREYKILLKQILHIVSLIDIIERSKNNPTSVKYENYKNIALREFMKERAQVETAKHKATIEQPLEKLLHQILYDSLLSSYLYLNKQVRRQMELHGYGSNGIEIFTRDVLWWIFKIYNSIKVMEKSEKEKIKQEQDKQSQDRLIHGACPSDDFSKMHLINAFNYLTQDKVTGSIPPNLISIENRVFTPTLYHFPELDEEFSFEHVLIKQQEHKTKTSNL